MFYKAKVFNFLKGFAIDNFSILNVNSGIKEMTPEQTLIEFISTSASLHGVTRQSIRQLEWDILKVYFTFIYSFIQEGIYIHIFLLRGGG